METFNHLSKKHLTNIRIFVILIPLNLAMNKVYKKGVKSHVVKTIVPNQLNIQYHKGVGMKKVLLVLFVLVVAVSLSTAGTPMTSQGSKALSFVINGLGDFGVSDANAGFFNTPLGT